MSARNHRLGVTALLGATLIWGSSFIILKMTLDSVPPLWILTMRFIGAAVIMAAVGFKSLKNIDQKCLKYGVQLGVIIASAYILQTYGLMYTTPGKNSFLTSSYCILVPFLCWAVYKKRPDIYNISAAFICVVGMGLVSLNGDMTLGIGDGLTICCGFFYAMQILVIDKAVERYSVVLISMIQFAAAGVICFIAALTVSPFPADAPASAWVSIAYMCVMCTGVCFLLQAIGQKYTPPGETAILLTLESVFGTLLSVIFYREQLSARVVLGFLLIFVSVLVSETKLGFLKKRGAAVIAEKQ